MEHRQFGLVWNICGLVVCLSKRRRKYISRQCNEIVMNFLQDKWIVVDWILKITITRTGKKNLGWKFVMIFGIVRQRLFARFRHCKWIVHILCILKITIWHNLFHIKLKSQVFMSRQRNALSNSAYFAHNFSFHKTIKPWIVSATYLIYILYYIKLDFLYIWRKIMDLSKFDMHVHLFS